MYLIKQLGQRPKYSKEFLFRTTYYIIIYIWTVKTKEKILATSLEMFNNNGVQEVSLREIAREINISVGNLNYHFPTTNDIIYALSLQLIDELNTGISKMMESKPSNSMISLHSMMKVAFTTQLNYRFIFNARYAEVVTSIPEMQTYTQQTFAHHFGMGKQMHEQLIKDGYLKKELSKDLDGFIYLINNLGIYWQQEIAIFQPKFSDNKKIEHALAIYFQCYTPYLTEKGRKALSPLLKELKPYKI